MQAWCGLTWRLPGWDSVLLLVLLPLNLQKPAPGLASVTLPVTFSRCEGASEQLLPEAS
jgi:hypothetical protein